MTHHDFETHVAAAFSNFTAAGAAAPGAPLAEAMVTDLKRAVFPNRKIKMRRVVGGKAEVGEV